MRSTRKSEAYAGLVALALLGVTIALVGWFMPPEPATPRWRGAGRETPRRGGTFVFHHESDVRGFDPHISFDEISNMGIKILFEGLIDYDPEDITRFVPRLAEALPTISEDQRTYTFRLRRGLRFANSPVFPGGRGREITAQDVRWSLEHMLHPDTGSPGITFFTLVEGYDEFRDRRASHVAGIRVHDRYTVSITLSRPDATFIYAMAMTFAYPVPREAYARYGDQISRHPVGTGAYVLASWEPGVELVFRRNPNYFIEGQPYPDRMIFVLNLRREPAVMRFRNGDLDHIHRQSVAQYLRLRDMEAWAPYRVEQPKVNIWGIGMNTQMEPFSNRHIRRAVAFAINREQWRRARANRLILTGQPIPRSLLGFDENLPGQHRYDLPRAREEMRLAGHPNGLRDPVQIWLSDGPVARIYGELIQQDLRAIGIDVELKQVSFPVYLEESGQPGHVQMLLNGWSMDYPDPSNFLEILFHSRSIHDRESENKSFYSNPELDRLLDAARVEPDRERRTEMYRQASSIIVEDAPWGFVFSDLAMEMWQPYVRGYRPNPVWSNMYRDLWLDLPRERWTWGPRYEGPASRVAAFAPLGGRGLAR
jgi:ABC-type transport system substrate-binding protein